MSSSPSPSSSSTPTKMIRLQSSDGQRFDVEEKVALLSETLKYIIEDDCADKVIPMPNVNAKCLTAVIEYCKAHAESESEDVLKKYDDEFVLRYAQPTSMMELMMAANHLNVKGLLDLLCQGLANILEKESVENVRQILGIENDFTEEEENEIRQENAWAFD